MNLLLQGLLRSSESPNGLTKVDDLVQRAGHVIEELTVTMTIELVRVKNQGPDAKEANELLNHIHAIELVLDDWAKLRKRLG